jgi:cobyrinic acid a,c-diamide synthase
MVLGESLNGEQTFGLLQGKSMIQPKLQGLGTQHLENESGTIGAHTFHYGQFDSPMTPTYTAQGKYGAGEAIYCHQSITASFLHFYFPSNHQHTAQFFTS